MTFKEIVEGKGFTAESLAEMTGYSETVVRKFVTGETPIGKMRLDKLIGFARALGMKPSEMAEMLSEQGEK